MQVLHALVSIIAALGIGFGLGWWVRGRGIAGIRSDIQDAKDTIGKIKG